MIVRIILVAVVHTLILGAILGERAYTLMTGREIVLRTAPVDPRDLFRGDYVILSYAIRSLDLASLAGEDTFKENGSVYVVLAPKDGLFEPKAVYAAMPAKGALAPDQVVLRGHIDYIDDFTPQPDMPPTAGPPCAKPCKSLRVTYGIESYFVPEGRGRDLEQARQESRLDVVVAVTASGEGGIKALRLDGKTIAVEGIF